MIWWQWVLVGLGVPVVIVAAYLGFWILVLSGKWCRCGHGWRIHVGRDTDCAGWYPRGGGINALGIELPRQCECPAYRQTERSPWRRLLVGAEEWPS